MTGLNPATDVIVEIATIVTDDELNIVAEGPDLVIHQPASTLANMDDVVVAMHTRSGLLEAIEASAVTHDDARLQTMAFLIEHIKDANTVPLCGNSIATDRRFLAAHMPELEAFFHYRSIDVSTVKELARRWYPEDFRRAPRKVGGHRARDDIRESIEELRYYRTAVFRG